MNVVSVSHIPLQMGGEKMDWDGLTRMLSLWTECGRNHKSLLLAKLQSEVIN